jgi:phenylacetic acid degradation operon negative regulatory protein
MANGKQAGSSGEDLLAGEPLQPQDLVITLLGTYVRPHHDYVWSGGLVRLLGELGFSTGAARVALTRLVRRDLIARVRRGRFIYYEITDRAETLLAEGDRRIFSLGRDVPPASVWTVVWHDIPESRRMERGRLGRRLRFLGFGTLQDGLWTSPHNRTHEVSPVCDELGIAEHVGIVVGRTAGSLGPVAMVRRAWDTEALAARYRAFAERFSAYADGDGMDDREAFVVRTHIVHLFRGFALLDPNLPDELLPDTQSRAEAIATFHSAYRALSEPAQRYFDLAISAAPAGPSQSRPAAIES